MSPFDSAEPSVRKTLARWLYNNVSSAIPLFLWSLFTEQAKGRKVIIGQVQSRRGVCIRYVYLGGVFFTLVLYRCSKLCGDKDSLSTAASLRIR